MRCLPPVNSFCWNLLGRWILLASHAEPQTSDAGPQAVGVVDYGDPDALKKAILQYEILGKPLALRDPSEGFPSF